MVQYNKQHSDTKLSVIDLATPILAASALRRMLQPGNFSQLWAKYKMPSLSLSCQFYLFLYPPPRPPHHPGRSAASGTRAAGSAWPEARSGSGRRRPRAYRSRRSRTWGGRPAVAVAGEGGGEGLFFVSLECHLAVSQHTIPLNDARTRPLSHPPGEAGSSPAAGTARGRPWSGRPSRRGWSAWCAPSRWRRPRPSGGSGAGRPGGCTEC